MVEQNKLAQWNAIQYNTIQLKSKCFLIITVKEHLYGIYKGISYFTA